MAVPISNVTRRQVYAPSGAGGAGPYAFTFEILANTDIAVYKDDTLLTLTTHYTVTINVNGTGSVTITAGGLALSPTSPTQYAIVGNRTISRSTDFTTGGDFFANVLNDELDQQTIFAQQNAEGLQRALSAPQTDPTSINMTLPRASVRAGKYLGFDSSGNPVADGNIPNVIYYGSISSNPTQRPNATAMQTGDLYFNTIAAELRVYNGSSWTAAAPKDSVLSQRFTATAGQTTFTVTNGYNTSAVFVYLNGVLLSTSDYTASNGSTVVLSSAASLNDEVVVYTVYSSSDTAAIRDQAVSSAASATASATAAAASATTAAGSIAPVTSTSSTSLSISTGSKSLTVETGKQWVPGMAIKIAVTASAATNFMTGVVTSYNTGTGALVVDVTSVGGSGTYSAWSISLPNGLVVNGQYLVRVRTSGTSYTPTSSVSRFWVFVFGASAGGYTQAVGGAGGTGYSEKYYPTPSGSYSYTIGAGGAGGTSGGTTTFHTISVSGSVAAGGLTGASGGSGSGGDFNANGGSGGNADGTNLAYPGRGGPSTRAGNGGNGGAASGSTGGGAGGTGGNNASGGTGGSAATAVSGSALSLPWSPRETFSAGGSQSAGNHGAAANGIFNWDTIMQSTLPSVNAVPLGGAQTGTSGVIIIVEQLK